MTNVTKTQAILGTPGVQGVRKNPAASEALKTKWEDIELASVETWFSEILANHQQSQSQANGYFANLLQRPNSFYQHSS